MRLLQSFFQSPIAFLAMIAVLVTSASSGAARAQPVPGADDPAYQKARDAWLADESTVLCQLIDVSKTGNAAAYILYDWAVSTQPSMAETRCEEAHPDLYTACSVFRSEDALARIPALELTSLIKAEQPEEVLKAVSLGELRLAAQLAFSLSPKRRTPQSNDQALPSEMWASLSPRTNPGMDPDLMLHLVVYAMYIVPDELTLDEWLQWYVAACAANVASDKPFIPMDIFCSSKTGKDLRLIYDYFIGGSRAKDPNPLLEDLKRWLAEGPRSVAYRTICSAICPGAQASYGGLCCKTPKVALAILFGVPLSRG